MFENLVIVENESISKNGDNFLKIQNISSSISQSFQQGDSINIELNTAVGTIFKNERST